MTKVLGGGLFNFADRMAMTSMEQRLVRHHVLTSNIANSETPGYRAIGYDFEEQLQEVANTESTMKTTHPRHYRNEATLQDGTILPDVFVRPTESVGQDGNTVDLDLEMAEMSKNQILYRSAVELLNRKIGTLRYAINGGR